MAADVAGAEMRSPPPASTVLMHAGVLALVLAPLVATSGLFLIDVPNHAFRSRLIMDLLNGKESTFYEFHLRLIPNLPIDVFAALTRNLLDPTIAVLALTCVACAGFYLSVVWWRWSRGRPTRLWMCLLLVLALYSKPLYFGLINYILALAIMNVGLARLEARAEHPSIGFSASQTVLVLLMYLCSLFAVVLYFSWILGTALFDGLRGPQRHFRDVVRRDARIHLPPVLIIFGVILMANPVPPAEAARNTWAIDLKFAALGSIGRMSNLPHELLFSLLVFSLLGFGLWIGALRIRPRLLAGLCGVIASFIIVPGKL